MNSSRELLALQMWQPSKSPPESHATTGRGRMALLVFRSVMAGQWDFTCSCTLAPTHISTSASGAGKTAERREDQKLEKYHELTRDYDVTPICVESLRSRRKFPIGNFRTKRQQILRRHRIHNHFPDRREEGGSIPQTVRRNSGPERKCSQHPGNRRRQHETGRNLLPLAHKSFIAHKAFIVVSLSIHSHQTIYFNITSNTSFKRAYATTYYVRADPYGPWV